MRRMVLLASMAVVGHILRAQSQPTAYGAMAPVDQYLMPSRAAEIELARTAAPAAISSHAQVMVLTSIGYSTAVKGTNGFVCVVQRSFAAPTSDAEFWNPKTRSPICLNGAGARTVLPIILMKARLAFARKTRTEIARTLSSAFDTKELPALEPGAMSYMMSRRQYLGDRDTTWHPHLMFFVPGNAAATWGANEDGGPIIAGSDADARWTIMMVTVGHWSDGTEAARN